MAVKCLNCGEVLAGQEELNEHRHGCPDHGEVWASAETLRPSPLPGGIP